MQKGDSECSKSVSPDDDFGKDFFHSWKSRKLETESIDFDMETVPKNKKGTFKFDELDSFELSGNFEKLASFKLDIPNLDFSNMSKKDEKTHEKSSIDFAKGKDFKENKFSFDFDFNSFDLDSQSEEDKSHSKCTAVPEHSSKNDKNQDSSKNIIANTNVLTERHSDFAPKTEVSTYKQIASVEDKQKETGLSMIHAKNSLAMHLGKEDSNDNQVFHLRSFSGNNSGEALLPDQIGTIQVAAVNCNSVVQKGDPRQPINSSPSRSSSPVDSYNSGCWPKAGMKQLQRKGAELQKHLVKTQLAGTSSLNGPIKITKDVFNFPCSNKSTMMLKAGEVNSNRNLLLPLPRSELNTQGFRKLSRKTSPSMQSNMMGKLEDNPLQHSPAFKSKQSTSMMDIRTKSTHASTIIESSSSQQNSVGANNMSEPRLQKLTTASPTISSAENSMANPNIRTSLSSQAMHSERKNATLDVNCPHSILNSSVTKTTKVSNDKLNSSMHREVKSVRFLEKRIDCPVNTAFKQVLPATREMPSFSNASLKRKTNEESVADLEASNSSKCVKESSAKRRKSLEASSESEKESISDIKSTEALQNAASIAKQTSSNTILEMKIPEFAGVPSYLEDDNLRMAETFTKELDNICSKLRKKHEEAKELQVRSIINNNALLLLNYPMLEEKFQKLQIFVSSLLLKEI